MRFPKVSGYNLEQIHYQIPSDLEGDFNLLIIPFKRWQQSIVDSWSEFLTQISKKLTQINFKFYELPTLAKGYTLMSFIIDGGMRAGIPDKAVRERTITLYLDKKSFKNSLNIENEDTIYLFLIDKIGNIFWQSQGKFKESLADEMLTVLIKNSY
jgi:hypothetical protein